ncbi:MAG TPA: TonB-dependent receptor [Steroidobacteraceae bacterium]|jgi:outer membrane receptor protein involved in Fe transport|nr:TonB-dependent receptor [Steroidobacteraceae bacterium]
MVNPYSGNPLVRAAVRTVLTGGALAATFGLAQAQQAQADTPADSQAGSTQQTNGQIVVAQASAAATVPLSGAQAQLQEVVVTGSRIASPNQTSISPVTFVNANTFAQMGATRVEDVLNRLPQVFAAQNATSINGGNGTETVNLRGLNPKRTLVLVDGLRMGPGDPRNGGSPSDVKMIPTALIENVQILTGGASSIYGADAVAGVVNFKLLDNFQGVKIIANGAGYFHSNNNDQGAESAINTFNATNPGGAYYPPAPSSAATGATKEITFIGGLNAPDGKGNATFYLSYRNTDKATQNLYSYSACSLASGFKGGPFSCSGSATSYPGFFSLYKGGKVVADNTVGTGGTLLPQADGPLYNYGPLNYMQAPDVVWTAGAFMHYDVNSHVTVYNTTMFMDDTTALQIAPSGDFNNPISINCDNPLLSASQAAAWCYAPGQATTTIDPKDQLLINRRAIESGNRVTELEHTDWREVLGVKGPLSQNWTYDISYQLSMVNLQQTSVNDLSVTKLNYALDDVTNPANGQVVCAATLQNPVPTLATGCQPWDIFAPGAVSPASAAYVGTTAVQRGQVLQQIVEADFTGDLSQYVQLPTAHSGLQVAVGSEYIDVHSYTQPDQTFQAGDLAGAGGATLPVQGTVESVDEYVEAKLPLLQDKPFAKSLDMDDSYRHSHYAQGFDTNTFSAGLEWAPSQDVRVRGTFTRAVRAPNVVELFSVQNVVLDGTTDPCAGAAPTYSAAQCALTGVSASQYGSISPNPATQYNGKTGGNANLKPETAITTSVGLGLTPHWVPNLRVQIDYYDIKIENIIRAIGFNTIVNSCATSDQFCDLVHRDALGSLWLTSGGYVTDTLANVGTLEEKGIDFDASYQHDLGRFGRLSSTFNGSYLDSYDVTPIAAEESTSYNCAGFYGPTCSGSTAGSGQPVMKWHHVWSLNWDTPWQPLSLYVDWRYMGSTTLEFLSSNPNLGKVGATVANGKIPSTDVSIPAYNYIDFSGAYQITDGIMFRLGVNNVMDKSPPIIGSTSLPAPAIGNGNTMPGTYDWGGRYVFGEISMQF